ncbi:MAG: nucleotidyltransferase domain-containing protein [Nitrospirota bacterium]
MVSKSIIQIFKSNLNNKVVPEEIVAIYIYGSILKGKLRIDSDIDISILASHRVSDIERLQLISITEGIFMSLLKEMGFKKEVSVLDMRGRYVSLKLIYKIITEGMLIYERDKFARMEFENAVKGEYFDFKPYLEYLMKKRYGDLLQKT